MPVIVGYKVAPITAFIARRLLKVSYVSLLNIAVGRRVLPEFLQQECSPRKLSDAITELLVDKTRRENQISKQLLALKELNSGGESGYSKAAAIVRDAVVTSK